MPLRARGRADGLHERQRPVRNALARRHLVHGLERTLSELAEPLRTPSGSPLAGA